MKRSPALDWLPLLAMAAYLALFVVVPLPTLEQVVGGPFRRIDLLQLLLLPEVLGETWFGIPAQFAITDRLGVLLPAVGVVLAATSAGWLTLRGLRVAPRLTRLERVVFAAGTGLGLASAYASWIGMLGLLQWPIVTWLPGCAVMIAAGWDLWRSSMASRGYQPSGGQPARSMRPTANATAWPSTPVAAANLQPAASDWLSPHWLWLVAPLVLVLLLGGALPSVHFDVLEYHLQAPKEFYQFGRITFLPHNVYANMPAGGGMFALIGMVSTGDWWFGGLIGKSITAMTALVTALGLLAAGRRLDSTTAGVVAAIVYLGTPWIAHVATAGLVESTLAMYTLLAVHTLLLAGNNDEEHTDRAMIVLSGLLAGCAAACKYPAVVFIVVPLLAWTLLSPAAGSLARRALNAGLFAFAVVIGGGAWYLKNLWYTGNPFYPLLAELFGGSSVGWTTAAAAQWNAVHRPAGFSVGQLAEDLRSVLLASEWLGPMTIPLAVMGLVATWWWRRPSCRSAERKTGKPCDTLSHREDVRGPADRDAPRPSSPARPPRASEPVGSPWEWWLIGYFAVWLILWWMLTHRIDRFWVPGLPLLALLAGRGARWSDTRLWRGGLLALLVISSAWGQLASAVPVPGRYPRYFVSSERVESDPRRLAAWHAYFRHHPPEGRVLMVGEAAVYDAPFPILYGTCFDHRWLSDLFVGRRPAEIRAELKQRGVSHVLVNWSEIARYRRTDYGFPAFINPELFDRLVAAGVLVPIAGERGESIVVYRVP